MKYFSKFIPDATSKVKVAIAVVLVTSTAVVFAQSNDLESQVQRLKSAIEKAKQQIINLTTEIEIGKTYKGEVVSIVPFGMFIAIYTQQGLCHISEIAHERVNEIEKYYKEGDSIEVKVLDIDKRGKVSLSRKALLPKPTKPSETPAAKAK